MKLPPLWFWVIHRNLFGFLWWHYFLNVARNSVMFLMWLECSFLSLLIYYFLFFKASFISSANDAWKLQQICAYYCRILFMTCLCHTILPGCLLQYLSIACEPILIFQGVYNWFFAFCLIFYYFEAVMMLPPISIWIRKGLDVSFPRFGCIFFKCYHQELNQPPFSNDFKFWTWASKCFFFICWSMFLYYKLMFLNFTSSAGLFLLCSRLLVFFGYLMYEIHHNSYTCIFWCIFCKH